MRLHFQFLFLLSVFSFNCNAQIDTLALNFGTKIYLESKIGSEKIEAWMRLPSNFEEVKDSVSLLILLDGDEYFKMASDVTELYEWCGKMKPTVIIGLPSTTESRWKYFTPTNVQYEGKPNPEDSLLYSTTGNFQKFADIISKELVPILETFLKVKFEKKTIFGHSNGGLGVMNFYAFRPEIFDHYIAASPAILWDNYYLQNHIGTAKKSNNLYMTLATGGWDYDIKSFKTIRNKIKNTNKNFKFTINNQESHSTNGLRTLLDGLNYVNKN